MAHTTTTRATHTLTNGSPCIQCSAPPPPSTGFNEIYPALAFNLRIASSRPAPRTTVQAGQRRAPPSRQACLGPPRPLNPDPDPTPHTNTDYLGQAPAPGTCRTHPPSFLVPWPSSADCRLPPSPAPRARTTASTHQTTNYQLPKQQDYRHPGGYDDPGGYETSLQHTITSSQSQLLTGVLTGALTEFTTTATPPGLKAAARLPILCG